MAVKRMKNKIRINCLCFELTRRCNMNCDFCCRGDAQNLDISTQIIDAALDKVKDYEIYTIRITGGEPFLNKKGLIYLIDEIIRRKIMISEFFVFTNGTVTDSEIKEALIKIGRYCKKCSDSDYGKRMKAWIVDKFSKEYNTHSFVNVIISTVGHRTIDMECVLDFYKYSQDESILCSYNQYESFIRKSNASRVEILLEGNGTVNFKMFIEEGKYQFAFVNNKYCLIDDRNVFEDGYLNIVKTITMSSNGNVFAGCSQSYDKVDKENICNIIEDCDLFKCIDLYSWKYPLLSGQNEFLKSWMIGMWNYEHGIGLGQYLSDSDKPDFQNDKRMYGFFGKSIECMKDLEAVVKQVHNKYQYFSHYEAAIMALYSKSLQWYDEMEKAGESDKKTLYLQICSGESNQETYSKITREEIEQICIDLCNIYKQRILENDPLCRFLYKIGVL